MSEETEVRTHKLVFNGINGATGEYGLPPMTCEDLAARIAGDVGNAPERAGQLQAGLDRGSATKIAAIVRWLAESTLEDAKRDAAWHSRWIEKLARKLAAELLDESYATPGQLRLLAGRLRRRSLDKLESIVRFLAQGQAAELAELLLTDQDEAPDEDWDTLEKHLERDAERQLVYVQTKLLDDSRRADVLEGDVAAQRNWLEALTAALYLTPLTALSTGPDARKAREALVKMLGALARNHASIVWLDNLLVALRAKSETLSWYDLIQTLHDGLDARIAAGDEAIPWRNLLTTLYNWLVVIGGSPRAVIESVDPTDLMQTGWGMIFPARDTRPGLRISEIKAALAPLLELRQAQAGERFRIYEGGAGYRPNDTAASFLGRYMAVPSDPVDPKKVPYYLLIVGSPEEIPFHFQYQLDVQYAVGRIDFDNLESFAHYARSVVAAEKGDIQRPLSAAFFGVANPEDSATESMADHLVSPLYEQIQARHPAWQVEAVLWDNATKAQLSRLLGESPPALLFAASHGLEFPMDDSLKRQRPHQGALLCQDWPGPNAWRGQKIPQDFYLAGDDLSQETNLFGMIAVFFACYSAGTPYFDEYTRQDFKAYGKIITEQPFIAALPKAMLSRPRGGALAVVGHVERAWGSSFLDMRCNEQIAVFSSAIERLLKGQPVGLAMEYFNGRYAALSTELTATLESYELPGEQDPYELARLWTANNDARGYIVIGDPAVRLPVARAAEPECDRLANSQPVERTYNVDQPRQAAVGARRGL